MLRLRHKNPVPEHLARHHPFSLLTSDYPLKPRVSRPTNRRFQIVSLPQRDGSFVASVVEAPEIVMYDQSRKAAEEKVAKEFLRRPNSEAYKTHPLATTKAVTIDMEYDGPSKSFVTYVKELHGMSTFGDSESEALDNTAEMIRGYIRSMEASGNKIRLAAGRLAELKQLVGIR